MGRDSPNKKRKKSDNSTSTSNRRQKTNARTTDVVMYQEYCELPFTLHTILVDEYQYITRKGFDSLHRYDCEISARPARSVHDLPAKVTVKQVLQQYQRKRCGGGSKKKRDVNDNDDQDEEKRQSVKKFCDGLSLLFDDTLPVCLLYPQERPQYESLQHDEDLKLKRPCEIYGSTFLLRLIMRLPRLLIAEPQSEMDEMGPMIADLIVLLQKNRQACFGKDTYYREPRFEELLPWEQRLQKSADHKKTSQELQRDDS